MKIAIIGRTRWLLDAAVQVIRNGHTVPVVWTCPSEELYDVKEADFERFARDVGAEFINDVAINTEANVRRLASFECEIALSVNWLIVLGPAILGIFPLGVLNAHAGDLPRFQGNACPNWAIIAGEPHVGLCIHQMAPELDAGPVLVRDRFPLDDSVYIGDIYTWLEVRVPEMFAAAVDGLASGKLKAVPQPRDGDLTLRAYPRRPEDGHIDWSLPAQTILRLVRASSRPFSGAHTTLEGQRRVTIWRAELAVHPGRFLAIPGQVCYRIGNDPVIACSDGVVRLTDVDLEGCKGSDEAKLTIGRSLRSRLV